MMYKALNLFNYAIVNILFVNIYLDSRATVVGQTLKLSVNEKTKLDALSLRGLFRKVKYFHFDLNQGNDTKVFLENQKRGKVQKQLKDDEKFFCDVNGPGKRSQTIPSSVHSLTPGDIDVVGAMGDSLTATNGALALTIPQLLVQNRGMSALVGGQGTWREFLTLPNILKEYNPKLYGYAIANGYSFQKISRFNVAEFGTMSRDLPYMARVLVHRMSRDPKVNVLKHWKLININIGGNDFCNDMCYHQDPYETANLHEMQLTQTLRILRESLPRTMVNVISPPDVFALMQIINKPKRCEVWHILECPCLFANNYRKDTFIYKDVVKEWHKRQQEVVDRSEFNTQDFTVNVQKYPMNLDIPLDEEGLTDFSYFSSDCFHLSQKGNAAGASSLWNNLLDPYDNKTPTWRPEFEEMRCPTNEHPFIRTREN